MNPENNMPGIGYPVAKVRIKLKTEAYKKAVLQAWQAFLMAVSQTKNNISQ
jgi:hypothetical protein